MSASLGSMASQLSGLIPCINYNFCDNPSSDHPYPKSLQRFCSNQCPGETLRCATSQKIMQIAQDGITASGVVQVGCTTMAPAATTMAPASNCSGGRSRKSCKKLSGCNWNGTTCSAPTATMPGTTGSSGSFNCAGATSKKACKGDYKRSCVYTKKQRTCITRVPFSTFTTSKTCKRAKKTHGVKCRFTNGQCA